MTRRIALGLLVFCVLGFAASGLSAYVHYRLLTEPGYTSFCSISPTWNCEGVYESRFGAFKGVPVAIGGLIWFLGATMLALAAWPAASAVPAVATGKSPKARKPSAPALSSRFADYAPLYLFAWSVIGLAFVMYFAYASFAVLKTVCVLCLVTYVSVIGIFILSGSGTDLSMRSLPGRVLRDVRALMTSPAALVAVLLFVAFAASAVAFFPRQPEETRGEETASAAAAPQALDATQQAAFETYYKQQPRVPLPVANDGAKVVIVKFNDYMCPPCGQTFAEYKPILAKYAKQYPGKLKFVTKDYPLDPECNRLAPGGSHMASCEAAVSVRLAREKGKAAEMEDWLFANQPTLTAARVKEAARIVGGVSDFDARYAATLELVKGDIEQGGQLQVQGTPTFFLNGIRLPGLRAEFLDAAIAMELKRAGVAVK
jgi:uncharacterized membrane protein/protein-disulfide isomerase